MTAPRSTFWFDDNKLYVSREVWSDIAADPSVVGLAGVAAAATAVIRHQGAFLIDGGEHGIDRRIDRIAEFAAFIEEVNSRRGELGLQVLGT